VDKLHESLWDALKLALFTALDQPRAGYLLYAAPETAWAREGHCPDAIFAGGSVTVSELLHERHPELWGWCLTGTRTTRPVSLPASVRSEPIASATVRSPRGDWELRCVRVQGETGAGWIEFDRDGWPAGDPVRERASAAEPAAVERGTDGPPRDERKAPEPGAHEREAPEPDAHEREAPERESVASGAGRGQSV
jgi:hypothetical protein